jgi:hypothetical protein
MKTTYRVASEILFILQFKGHNDKFKFFDHLNAFDSEKKKNNILNHFKFLEQCICMKNLVIPNGNLQLKANDSIKQLCGRRKEESFSRIMTLATGACVPPLAFCGLFSHVKKIVSLMFVSFFYLLMTCLVSFRFVSA